MVDQDQSDDILPNSVFITTSRHPTHFLRRASKVLNFSIPNSLKLNRGSLNQREIYRYCWNRRIPFALILQNTGQKDIVEVKAYKIGMEVQAMTPSIKLLNMIQLKRHNRETRIDVDSIQLQFASTVQQSLKDRLIEAFNPLLRLTNVKTSENLLFLRFRIERSNILIGEAIQKTARGSLLLFNLLIQGCSKDEG
ncbi:MAG: hypothetical protein ACFFE8_08915 [Candidatus Heimdallarchaeota archaeon]